MSAQLSSSEEKREPQQIPAVELPPKVIDPEQLRADMKEFVEPFHKELDTLMSMLLIPGTDGDKLQDTPIRKGLYLGRLNMECSR